MSDSGTPPIFVLWLVFAAAGGVAFWLTYNATWKRRWWPAYCVGGAVFYTVAVFQFPDDSGMAVAMVPIVFLIAWVNIILTRFCDQCGRTIGGWVAWARPDFCSACGAPLRR